MVNVTADLKYNVSTLLTDAVDGIFDVTVIDMNQLNVLHRLGLGIGYRHTYPSTSPDEQMGLWPGVKKESASKHDLIRPLLSSTLCQSVIF